MHAKALGFVVVVVVAMFAGCGLEAPRCRARVVQSPEPNAMVDVYGDTAFSCDEIGRALSIAWVLLKTPLPRFIVPPTGARLTFHEGRYFFASDGDKVGGTAWCGPFEMDLGTGTLHTAESSMCHELAHWGIGQELGRADCGGTVPGAEGGHVGWEERGIYAACQRWDDGF